MRVGRPGRQTGERGGVSILYLRCEVEVAHLEARRRRVGFNSLFEMLEYKTGGYGRGVVPILFQFSI